MASLFFGRIGILVLLSHARWASASSFLSRAQEANSKELTPELEASIVREVETVLSGSSQGITQDRLARIEDMLRPTFRAMPKNEVGKLAHSAVRYMLHSYFVQHHAWHVRGLASLGDEGGTTSPGSILQDKVEEFVQSAFEQRMGSQGLDLKDMSVLAATYENLVRHEMSQRLDQTLTLMDKLGQESMSLTEADSVIDAYMMGYILNLNYTVVLPKQLAFITSSINKIYPTWSTTQQFLRQVRGDQSAHRSYFTRSDVESILEEVHDRYGPWQDRECRDLKSQMLTLEDTSIGVNGSGRVLLSDFYGSALRDGNWQFSESADYLTQNGALDTHGVQRVIIANYINSPSNCLASSKFYSVCCINECEELMEHVEHHFASPAATPGDIVEFVSGLQSSTVSSKRTLPTVLVQRLEEIALRHDGVVPLHGRLFAQWMHHAYPRECPFPHISGTTRPQTVKEYKIQTMQKPTITTSEMITVVDALRPDAAIAQESDECTEWSHHEELYVGHHRMVVQAGSRKRQGHLLRTFVYVCAVIATAVTLVQRWLASSKSTCGGKDVFV